MDTGANTARHFLRAHGVHESTVAIVWDAIALHTTPEIPSHKQPETGFRRTNFCDLIAANPLGG